MGSHSGKPLTLRQRVSLPRNALLYNTTLRLPEEKALPQVGALMGPLLGPSFAASRVIDVSGSPSRRDDDFTHTIQHAPVPSTHVEYESVAYNFPPIAPFRIGAPRTFYPGGSAVRQRVVTGQVTYEYSVTPADWDADPTTANDATTGPFEVQSYLAKHAVVAFQDGDGEWHRIGDWLNSFYLASNTLNDYVTMTLPGAFYYYILASVPSAATYSAWVASNTYFIASRTVTKWRGDIYMRVTTRVRAQ